MKKIPLKKICDIIKNNQIEVVLIGELHGWDKSLKIEENIIRLIKPNIFLHELLECYIVTPLDARRILNKKEWKSKVHSFHDIKQIFSIILKLKIAGRGHDLIYHGIRNIQDYYVTDRELTEKEEKDEQALTKRREEKQKIVILKILTSERPVIAISGSYHLRDDSPIIKSLRDKKMALIYPSINGNLYYGQEGLQSDKIIYIVKFLNVKDLKEDLQVIV